MEDKPIGLIPAAGKGERLGLPYPKELYPIIRDNRYKPIAQYVVENLTSSGVEDIVFVINETKHQLIGYFGDGHRFGCHFTYVVQEDRGDLSSSTSPGLSHALDSAYRQLRGKTVLFGMADTIMEPTNVFQHLLNAAKPDDQLILGLFKVSSPEKFGMVDFGVEGSVMQIIDKPKQTLLEFAWGCIVWRPEFTEHLHHCVSELNISDFAYVMNLAIKKGMSLRGIKLPEGRYADLGTYEEIVALDKRYRA